MQKKLLIGILILVVLVGGAYAIFHKTDISTPNYSASTGNTSTSKKTSSSSGDIIQTETASNVGQYLANSSGNALYTYGGDTNSVSNCSGSCIYSWPPYGPTASSTTTLPTNITIITRSDGTKQYAYKGMPLYTFSGDSSGQVTGNGVSNFNVAKP